jgi:hypothetical protein
MVPWHTLSQPMSQPAKLVMMALWVMQTEGHVLRSDIAEKLSISDRSARRAVAELARLGLVESSRSTVRPLHTCTLGTCEKSVNIDQSRSKVAKPLPILTSNGQKWPESTAESEGLSSFNYITPYSPPMTPSIASVEDARTVLAWIREARRIRGIESRRAPKITDTVRKQIGRPMREGWTLQDWLIAIQRQAASTSGQTAKRYLTIQTIHRPENWERLQGRDDLDREWERKLSRHWALNTPERAPETHQNPSEDGGRSAAMGGTQKSQQDGPQDVGGSRMRAEEMSAEQRALFAQALKGMTAE